MTVILLKVVSGALGFFYLYQVEASFTLFRRLLFCNVPVDEILARDIITLGWSTINAVIRPFPNNLCRAADPDFQNTGTTSPRLSHNNNTDL